MMLLSKLPLLAALPALPRALFLGYWEVLRLFPKAGCILWRAESIRFLQAH